jgi:hypothetical protein
MSLAIVMSPRIFHSGWRRTVSEQLRDVSISHVSRRSDTQTDRCQECSTSPATSKGRKHAEDLEAVSNDEAPLVERAPMLGSMIIKEIGERISHIFYPRARCGSTLRLGWPRQSCRSRRSL